MFIFGFVKIFQFFEQSATLENHTHESIVENPKQQENHVIVLDADHGGYDDGSIGFNNVLEKNITLDITLKVGGILESKNIKVIYVRKDDDYFWTEDNVEDLDYRVGLSQKYNADFYVSLHMNDTDLGNDIKGFEVYCIKDTFGEIMANNILESINNLSFTNNRGVIAETVSSLHVIGYNSVPSVLIEMGFIHNRNDFDYITSTDGSTALAKAISDGIIRSINDYENSNHK